MVSNAIKFLQGSDKNSYIPKAKTFTESSFQAEKKTVENVLGNKILCQKSANQHFQIAYLLSKI